MTAAPSIAKPLGHKAYGSIPHLPGSKRGPGDHGLEEAQAAILTTSASKDWTIVVQEKLDGSCMSVAKIGGEIVALGRAGFRAETSPYEHLRLFTPWVAARRDRFDALLAEGERVVGEWMLLATGQRYWIASADDLFFGFDIMRGIERGEPVATQARLEAAKINAIQVLHAGEPISVEHAWCLADSFSALDNEAAKPEGVIYRAVRKGRVSFLGKWVRSDFEPGRYLADGAVYNYPPQLLRTEAA